MIAVKILSKAAIIIVIVIMTCRPAFTVPNVSHGEQITHSGVSDCDTLTLADRRSRERIQPTSTTAANIITIIQTVADGYIKASQTGDDLNH